MAKGDTCGVGYKIFYDDWDIAEVFPRCRKLSAEELEVEATGLFTDITPGAMQQWLGLQELAEGADVLYAGKEALRQEGLATAKGATAAVEESARMVDPLVRQQAGEALMAATGGAGGMAAGGAKAATLGGVAQQSATTIAGAKGQALKDLAGQRMDEVLYKTQAGSSLEKATQKAADMATQVAVMREADATPGQVKAYLVGELQNEPKFVYDQKGDRVPNPVWGSAQNLGTGVGG